MEENRKSLGYKRRIFRESEHEDCYLKSAIDELAYAHDRYFYTMTYTQRKFLERSIKEMSELFELDMPEIMRVTGRKIWVHGAGEPKLYDED